MAQRPDGWLFTRRSETCDLRVLGLFKRAFYAWRRDWDEAHLINAVGDIHADDPAFGYRLARPFPAGLDHCPPRSCDD
jgi:hypothetical protein